MNKNQITFWRWLKSNPKSFVKQNFISEDTTLLSVLVFIIIVGVFFGAIRYFFGLIIMILTGVISICVDIALLLHFAYKKEVEK